MSDYDEDFIKRTAQQIRYGMALDIILVALSVAIAIYGLWALISRVRS